MEKNLFPQIQFVFTPSKQVLFADCVKIEESFGALSDSVKFLNNFYIETRYPGDYPEFSWEDAQKAFDSAEKIKKFVLSKIK